MKLQDVVELQHVVVPLTAQTVRDATERLAERLIASGVVPEAKRLHAVIRNAWPEDAGGAHPPSSDPRGLAVKDVMSRAVLCVSEDQTLSDVANLMNNKDVDRFPVVREGIVVGFLTRADLIRRLVATP